MTDVFQYLDYRAFLRDYYLEGKKTRGLSYRSISGRAGVKSSNFFKLVIEGKRNLSDQMVHGFAHAVSLTGDAAEYFGALVRFNQSKSIEERARAFEVLTRFRRYRQIHPLSQAQADYHSIWYLPAIRELVSIPSFRDDPKWISRTLRPRISPKEAEKALKTLLRLGLLKYDEQGRLTQADPLVSTGPEVANLHVVSFHQTMMKMAAESLEIPAPERDISSLTLSVGPEGLSLFKKKIQSFRRELLELSELESDPRQVIQVNFQLFPLSEVVEGKAK